ncbi:XRE family transcriptional regulator [Alloscardovia omnicolens]|nr:XRE family transcriptional regulator [Alloscardovia omnicolens]
MNTKLILKDKAKSPLQENVTRNMKIAMAMRGVYQKDLASALEITSAAISAKFTGKTLWNLEDIEKASEFFSVEPEALVAGHGFEPWTSGL